MADLALWLMDKTTLDLPIRTCNLYFDFMVFAGWDAFFNHNFWNTYYIKTKTGTIKFRLVDFYNQAEKYFSGPFEKSIGKRNNKTMRIQDLGRIMGAY